MSKVDVNRIPVVVESVLKSLKYVMLARKSIEELHERFGVKPEFAVTREEVFGHDYGRIRELARELEERLLEIDKDIR